MYVKLVERQAKLAVIGLGYVGLPLALAFSKKIEVIGFDINVQALDKISHHIDPSGEFTEERFQGSIEYSCSLEKLREASFYVVAVPTPIDEHNQPDLGPLLAACRTVGKVLKREDYVVFESTVYPGCTEEDCVPLLEEMSGLEVGKDFKVGYSPERINPGDKKHFLENIVKVVSGCDAEALETIAKVYGLVIEAGLHRAPSIKVAEAAKIIENTQRDVNIALMNELSILFSRMGINTYDVLEAAGTKWNFLKFAPGLVGGHCIGVDPYYLVYKAKELKYHPRMIQSGRFINDSMGGYIAKKMVKHLIALGKGILGSRVLVMGVTFKENVTDIRNTKVVDIVRELQDFGMDVDVIDPHADGEAVAKEYGIRLIEKARNDYDAVVVAVVHREYVGLDESYFSTLVNKNALMVDLKGVYKGKIHKLKYWSL